MKTRRYQYQIREPDPAPEPYRVHHGELPTIEELAYMAAAYYRTAQQREEIPQSAEYNPWEGLDN